MFVKILQYFGTFLIIAGIGALLLTRFQSQISELTGADNILLPYSIFVSVITAILGYSTKEGVENFFGGILLQVEPPFERGDRLVLDSGEVVDVREIGMRSTRLYDVLENIEISIPNKMMASQKVNNLSRPDLLLRVPIVIQVPLEGSTLKRVEAMLLDIAYFEPEVDQARVSQYEISAQQRRLGRRALEEHAQNLFRTYDKAKDVLAERILGRGKIESIPVYPSLIEILEKINKLRGDYREVVEEEKKLIEDALEAQKWLTTPEKVSKVLRDYAVVVSTWVQGGETDSCRMKEVLGFMLIEQEVDKSIPQTGGLIYRLTALIKKRMPGNELLIQRVIQNIERETKGIYDHHIKSVLIIAGWHKYLSQKRQAILLDISDWFGRASEFLYAIGDIHRDARIHMDAFVRELDKEPSVHSRFGLSEEGRAYIEISFRVFTTHLERRYDVMRKLHKDIQRYFEQNDIKILSISSQ